MTANIGRMRVSNRGGKLQLLPESTEWIILLLIKYKHPLVEITSSDKWGQIIVVININDICGLTPLIQFT